METDIFIKDAINYAIDVIYELNDKLEKPFDKT